MPHFHQTGARFRVAVSPLGDDSTARASPVGARLALPAGEASTLPDPRLCFVRALLNPHFASQDESLKKHVVEAVILLAEAHRDQAPLETLAKIAEVKTVHLKAKLWYSAGVLGGLDFWPGDDRIVYDAKSCFLKAIEQAPGYAAPWFALEKLLVPGTWFGSPNPSIAVGGERLDHSDCHRMGVLLDALETQTSFADLIRLTPVEVKSSDWMMLHYLMVAGIRAAGGKEGEKMFEHEAAPAWLERECGACGRDTEERCLGATWAHHLFCTDGGTQFVPFGL